MTQDLSEKHLAAFTRYLDRAAVRVDAALDRWIPTARVKPAVIHQSMRYTVLSPGKRLRPALVLLAYETSGGRGRKADPVAAALEMVHAFSLIHDDLPAMDDDDYRRGRLTNHKVFGEGVAILAGDALLTEAFETLAATGRKGALGPAVAVALVAELSKATGSDGVIGGQVLDLTSEGKKVSRATLDYIHRHKTARLFASSLRMGALAAQASSARVDQLGAYGEAIGLAFQIVDDLLNESGTFQELGRQPGRDRARAKATYPGQAGYRASHRAVTRELNQARRLAASAGKRSAELLGLVELIDRRRQDANGRPLAPGARP